MSDQNTNDTTTDQVDTEDNTNHDHGTENDGKNQNAEAAKYRRRLRDTEAQLANLTQKHETLLRSTIEQAAADKVTPAALWDSGATLDDLLGDDGLPDPEKVRAAANTAAERYQVAQKPRRPQPVPEVGRTNLNLGKPTWGDALNLR